MASVDEDEEDDEDDDEADRADVAADAFAIRRRDKSEKSAPPLVFSFSAPPSSSRIVSSPSSPSSWPAVGAALRAAVSAKLCVRMFWFCAGRNDWNCLGRAAAVPELLPDWAAAVGVDDEDGGNECAPFDAESTFMLTDRAATACCCCCCCCCCCDEVRFSMSSSESDADEDREAPEAAAAASTEDSGASGARDTVDANAGAAARGGRRECTLADIE